jgi:hypothetical protein
MTQSIIDRIKKLFALADETRNNSQHEREQALKAACELMAKHQLTELDINVVSPGSINVEQSKLDVRLDKWINYIYNAACMMYDTDFYISGNYTSGGSHYRVPVIVGTKENIAITAEIASWLVQDIRKESNKFSKNERERKDFRLGAASSLYKQAKAYKEEKLKDQTSTGTSLMVIKNAFEKANDDFMGKLNLKPGRSRSSYVGYGYSAGQEYGSKVNMGKQLGSNTPRIGAK